MRKALCVAALIVLAWTSVAGAQEAIFRGLQWGDPPDKLAALGEPYPDKSWAAEELAKEGITLWRVRQDNLDIGEIRLGKITYAFLNNRLFYISLLAASDEYGSMLQELAVARYGGKLGSTSELLPPLKYLYIGGGALGVSGDTIWVRDYLGQDSLHLISLDMFIEYLRQLAGRSALSGSSTAIPASIQEALQEFTAAP
ncbi:MAG: hypothetical protein ACM309_02750 [Bacillota bacterium]